MGLVRTRAKTAVLRLAVLSAALLVLMPFAAPRAHAATTWTVSTCDETHLDSAIAGAGSGDTATFTCSGTITLTHIIDIANSLTLDGGGSGVTISGGKAVTLFHVESSGNLTVKNLTLTGGRSSGSGGAIGSVGALTVLNSTFSNNSAAAHGGAIDDNPPPGGPAFVLSNSTFTGNSSCGGGALGLGSSVSLQATNDRFANNTECGRDGGGAILTFGHVMLANSTLSGNRAGYGGGIINDGGSVSLSNSTLSGNSAPPGEGGGILNYGGTLNVTNSAFTANSASGCYCYIGGGGIANEGGSVTVTNGTFANNSAACQGFCIGGAIFNDFGTVSISNSTIGKKGAGNSADYGGGVFNFDTLSIMGSTVTYNTATTEGGGIDNYGNTVTPTNTTIKYNTPTNCAGPSAVVGCTN
jgi:hypothetical protein